VHTADTISFVYRVSGQVRQQIKTGVSNENQIIVKEGLKQGDEVYLSPPENAINWKLSTL
jgi:cytochrome c-type biogenesis protein CcmH/NrfF